MGTRRLPFVTMALAMALCLGFGLRGASTSQAQSVPNTFAATQTTMSYRIELDIAPATMMEPSDQAMGQSTDMSMASAGTGDEMMPAANLALAVHVYDVATGAPVMTMTPEILATDQMTGMTTDLSNLMSMGAAQSAQSDMSASQTNMGVGQGDMGNGNDVYLADGTYTITVMVGSDTATFQDVAVSTMVMGPS